MSLLNSKKAAPSKRNQHDYMRRRKLKALVDEAWDRTPYVLPARSARIQVMAGSAL